MDLSTLTANPWNLTLSNDPALSNLGNSTFDIYAFNANSTGSVTHVVAGVEDPSAYLNFTFSYDDISWALTVVSSPAANPSTTTTTVYKIVGVGSFLSLEDQSSGYQYSFITNAPPVLAANWKLISTTDPTLHISPSGYLLFQVNNNNTGDVFAVENGTTISTPRQTFNYVVNAAAETLVIGYSTTSTPVQTSTVSYNYTFSGQELFLTDTATGWTYELSQ